jgi:OOP family OmpA-OmpF porin
LNFSVEGHTDSDGDDANNQKLSEARGKSVMKKLIEMGISANRLKSNGFGESKPIDNNSTPEGKANNRRVEFVKFTVKTSSNSSNIINGNSPEFDNLNRKSIADKLESLPDNFQIPISDKSGIVNGKGTIILYATSDGLMGKMEILDVDKEDNYKLTVKYVTYKYKGEIHSQSNKLEIEGTFLCDLDRGVSEGVSREEAEFFLKRADENTTTISPSETLILKIFTNH